MIEGRLREILAKLDITVISKDADGWLKARCPFAEFKHDSGTDRDPSFFAKVSGTQLSGFHCFTCKEHGRISSLVRKLEHWREEEYPKLAMQADLAETPDSFGTYEAEFDIDVDPTPLNKAAYMTIYPAAWGNEDAREYLQERGISEATAELMQLQFDPKEGYLLFPVFDSNNDLFGFAGRSVLLPDQIEEINRLRVKAGRTLMYSEHKDYTGLPKERVLLGDHLIQPDKPLWVVEGKFAYAHLIEIGARDFLNPVATLGSKMSKYQRDLLIEHNLPVYLGYDNDAAGELGIYGEKGREGAYAMLKQHVPTYIPFYPEGKNDPDELTYDELYDMWFEAESEAIKT